MLIDEIFVDIVGYEGYYQVSNYGCVRSIDRIIKCSSGVIRKLKGKILKIYPDSNGYVVANLCKMCNPKTAMVHRIVAQGFLTLPKTNNNAPLFVKHIDDNRLNNHASNLKYTTDREKIDIFLVKEIKCKFKIDEYLCKSSC